MDPDDLYLNENLFQQTFHFNIVIFGQIVFKIVILDGINQL